MFIDVEIKCFLLLDAMGSIEKVAFLLRRKLAWWVRDLVVSIV
jgi:hypothetical protein